MTKEAGFDLRPDNVRFKVYAVIVIPLILLVFRFFPDSFIPLMLHRGADKSLARPASRFILFHGENISFDASLVIYIYIYIYIYI